MIGHSLTIWRVDGGPKSWPEMEKVVADAAARIGNTPPNTEILVAAHSLGAICAFQILDAALVRMLPETTAFSLLVRAF